MLYQPSIQSKTARRKPEMVGQGLRSMSSLFIEAKNDSATALSQHVPLRPSDNKMPWSVASWRKSRLVYWHPLSELTGIRLSSDYAGVFIKPRNLGLAWAGMVA